MRIDKYLKVARLVKRRETAKSLCDDGDVILNGRPAKPMSEVNEGDTIVLKIGRHTITARIKEVRPFANKEEAGNMYEIISDEVSERRGEDA